jgi:hypothetical protein
MRQQSFDKTGIVLHQFEELKELNRLGFAGDFIV